MITVTFICDGDGCGMVAEIPQFVPFDATPTDLEPRGWTVTIDSTAYCAVCWAKITGEPVEIIRGGS